MDLRTENQNSKKIPFDLNTDSSTHDLGTESDPAASILSEIIEAFDMSYADDIDFPEFHSKQRESQNSDDPADELERINDAERILGRFSEIDKGSIRVSINDSRLNLFFRLKTGQTIRRIL